MDRLRALILVYTARIERERLLLRIRALEKPNMPGEIRDAMARLRLSKTKMIGAMLREIEGVEKDVAATHADGLEAMKLPRAELEATRAEIAEIRAEFAPKSNGDPSPGPLPGSPGASAPLSTGSEVVSTESAEKKIQSVT